MGGALTSLALSAALLGPQDEGRHYAVDHLVPPEGAVLEVGGMAFLPDGRLVVSTRRGQVWLVDDPLADDPRDARFTLFAEGLWEGLGVAVVDGVVHVVQRGELSRLLDVDGDDRCDQVVTVTDDWGLSENYHEFAYGLPYDDQGNAYVTLNVGFFSPRWWHGKAVVPYRGWVLRVTPDGAVQPFACGFRSPAGVSLSPAGELFVTDNQGDWMPASPIFRVREGGFHGHPASLDWTPEYLAAQTRASDTVPPARAATDREPAAIWLPYRWSRSPGNLAWDQTGGLFGPFTGQVFVAELTNGMLLRADFEEVDGVLQGWVVPFRRGIGSCYRVLFADDGTLLVGLTNRGWGGLAPADGIARVRWTGSAPFELADVELLGADDRHPDAGFRLRFTAPVSEAWLVAALAEPAAGFAVQQYDYDYWWEYGSPERDTTALVPTSLTAPAPDVLELRVRDLAPGRVARVALVGLADQQGAPLAHDEFAYTVNRIPGVASGEHVARIVPPPPARDSDQEGWLRLTYGDATHEWQAEGWELVAAALDPDDPTRFTVSRGNSHLTNTAPRDPRSPGHFVSKAVFGDVEVHVDFTLPERGRAALWLQGAYGLALADSPFTPAPGPEECGAVIGAAPGEDVPPAVHAYRGAGQLHELDLVFRAPRFGPDGVKLEDARLENVRVDDVLLHESVVLAGPSHGAPVRHEAARGPLVFQGDGTQVAIGNVQVRPLGKARDHAGLGFGPLLDLEADDPLAGWRIVGDGYWSVDDAVLLGDGPRSYLLSPRGDYRDLETVLELKVSDGGNSGLLLRAPADGGDALQVEVNSSFADPRKTGSLLGLVDVRAHLVPPDTWFELYVACVDDQAGDTTVEVHVNGVEVARHVVAGGLPPGHLALEQHHDGSLIEVRRWLVRER